MSDALIAVKAGDDASLIFTVKYPDGTAPNLSGGRARWWMGPAVSSRGAAVLLRKDTISLGGVALALGGGFWTVTLTLTPADTKALAAKTYWHEVEVEDAGGKVSTVYSSPFQITPTLIASAL